MEIRKFRKIKILVTALLWGIIWLSLSFWNYIIPLISFVFAIGLLLYLKTCVKDVISDERDFEVWWKAARYTLIIVSIWSVFLSIIFTALHVYPYDVLWISLWFVAMSLLLIYSCLFAFFYRK